MKLRFTRRASENLAHITHFIRAGNLDLRLRLA